MLVLEAAPFDERGGNCRYTAGALRFVYNGVDDLLKLCDLSEKEIATSDFGTYTQDKYYDDLGRLTDYKQQSRHGRAPDHQEPGNALVDARQGHPLRADVFAPGLQARRQVRVLGRAWRWKPGAAGRGSSRGCSPRAEKNGIDVAYEARGERLIADDDGVHGVVANVEGKTTRSARKAVVLACGGFEANAEMRTRYLGPGWDLAKVRGTRFNTGNGIKMALEIGAMPYGNWSGCHAVGWDYNAPEFGDLAVGDNFQKHSYPFAIMVNADGERFCDEGADFRNYTYAKYGREILNQPHQFAWQIFDQQVVHLQRDEYRIRQVTKVTADTIEELADKMAEYAPVDKAAFLKTIREYNAAVERGIPYNPTVKDGRTTQRPGDRQDQLGDAAWKSRPSRPIARPAASPSPSAGCGSTPTAGCSTPRRSRSPGSMRPASWSAGCSTSIIRAAPASCRARCSARSPAPPPASRSGATVDPITDRSAPREERMSGSRATGDLLRHLGSHPGHDCDTSSERPNIVIAGLDPGICGLAVRRGWALMRAAGATDFMEKPDDCRLPCKKTGETAAALPRASPASAPGRPADVVQSPGRGAATQR